MFTRQLENFYSFLMTSSSSGTDYEVLMTVKQWQTNFCHIFKNFKKRNAFFGGESYIKNDHKPLKNISYSIKTETIFKVIKEKWGQYFANDHFCTPLFSKRNGNSVIKFF